MHRAAQWRHGIYVALLVLLLTAWPDSPVRHLAGGTQNLSAQEINAGQQLLTSHKAWRVFREGTGQTKSCYIVSEPIASLPTNVRRGAIFMSVTHRPGQGVRNEISLRVGYPFAKDSKPFAQIGTQNFNFFTGAGANISATAWAWLVNPAQHTPMIAAMKRGNRLVFKGRSARGTLTTDTYSLMGFTAAMQQLDKACPPARAVSGN